MQVKPARRSKKPSVQGNIKVGAPSKKKRRGHKPVAKPSPAPQNEGLLKYRTSIRFDFDDLPEESRKIVEMCRGKKWPFLIVGGFPRDWLAERKPHDVDMAIMKNGYSLAHHLKGEFVHARHPIVLVPGGAQVMPAKTLENYHKGRDFTVNALAIDWEGYVLDPVGGIADARARKIRQLLPDTIYLDPIRAFRACRLAARLGWKIEAETAKAMKRLARRRSRKDFLLGKEPRHSLELHKVFADPKPSLFFQKLREHNLLGHLFPPLASVWEQSPEIAENALKACDNAPAGNDERRMAALFESLYHDDPPRMAKIMKKFLEEINWNVVASNFERVPDFITADELVSAIMFKNNPFTDIESLMKIYGSFSGPKPALKRLISVINKIYGKNIPLGKLKTLREQAQSKLDGKRRIEALRFCDTSTKSG